MQLVSVNIGRERSIQNAKPSGKTGIYKLPAPGPVRITAAGLEGDFISDTEHHGGADQAVYVYGAADYEWWSRELGRELAPGTFGENLTVGGLESASFSIGDRLHAGPVVLEVTAPRMPCVTLAARMGDPEFGKRYRKAERPGLYCRVIQEGAVRAGDEVLVERYRAETVTILEMFRNYYARKKSAARLRRMLKAPIGARARGETEEQLSRLPTGQS